jgi:DNA-binding CsgD family transcriptional regulator
VAFCSQAREKTASVVWRGSIRFLERFTAAAEERLPSKLDIAKGTGVLRRGAFVTKDVPLGVLLRQATNPRAEKLTARQREVLQLLAENRAMKEVADLLHVTERTVAFHKYTIMEHLGLKTSAELVQYVLEHGMLKKQT